MSTYRSRPDSLRRLRAIGDRLTGGGVRALLRRVCEGFSLHGEGWIRSGNLEGLKQPQAAQVTARDSRIHLSEAARPKTRGQLRTRMTDRTKQAGGETVSAVTEATDSRKRTRITTASPTNIPDLFVCKTTKQLGRIAVILDVDDAARWPDVQKAIPSISEPYDLFVTFTTTHVEIEAMVAKAFPSAHILHFHNQETDVLPFVTIINSGILFRYQLLCKIGAKRSSYHIGADWWRHFMFNGTQGVRNLADRIVEAFEHDPDLGIVVLNGHVSGSNESDWADYSANLRPLGARLGIEDVASGAHFPSVSTYWIRPFLLRQLAALKLTPGDLGPAALVGRPSSRAVEQLLGLVCHDAGMRIVESAKFSNRKTTVAISRNQLPHLIAFYLPQFHPIPENDLWWGPGFTEWTNVTRAVPMFRDHRQPRLPADLGFYDLRLPEVREAQAALARRYGLSAFCYYYYWFNGRRLLHRPLDEVCQSGSPDFPFMICWANEPWSRNWDGGNREVLVPQTYEKGWVKNFARDIGPILKDKRYWRIEGKPVVLIYRVMNIPECASAFSQLRELLRGENIEVYLAAGWFDIQGDQAAPVDARELGIDSYFEFPPHSLEIAEITQSIREKASDFAGRIYSYDSAVKSALAKLHESPTIPRFRGVMMGWDNTARRMNQSHVLQGSTPAKFRHWLRQVIKHEAQVTGLTGRIIFINAWNEWAEGTYLEPDQEYGHAWLEAVTSSLGSGLDRL
jgi:lipopolysaccharide biosynthesis protein